MNISPTKSNLIKTKEILELAKIGYSLLDQKRSVLISEMAQLIDRAKEIQGEIDKRFNRAYQCLKVTNVTMGIDNVERIAIGTPPTATVEIVEKSAMGVTIPIMSLKKDNEKQSTLPNYSIYRTTQSLDTAVTELRSVLEFIVELAEVETSVYRLAKEIKSTQKRANALEYILIPRYEATKKFIEESLEEKSREEFFKLKVLKKKHSKAPQ